MATPKRPANFSHADRGGKRHQPARPTFNTAAYDHSAPSKKNIAARVLGPPQPKSALSTPELQTGLVALLDWFVAEETTPGVDRETLHHARELRRLLCARTDFPSSQAKRDLDVKRPNKAARITLPDWVERKVHAAKALPPLPPIKEPHLHQAVFTHRSAIRNPNEPLTTYQIEQGLDYERLEYIGDAHIELLATRALCNRFPQVDVPELCSWRERLVENSALSKFSDAYGFPERLSHRLLADPASKSWQKVSADIFEAYVAALVESDPTNGFAIAEDWLTELWAPQLLGFQAKVIENLKAKDELNKLVVCKGITLDYRQDKPMTYDTGSIQRFYVGIYLTGWGYDNEWVGSGEGQTKHQAAIAAAIAAMKNSAVIRDASQKKAALMEVKRLEREKEAREREEGEGEGEEGGKEKKKEANNLAAPTTAPPERTEEAQPSSPLVDASSRNSQDDGDSTALRKRKADTDNVAADCKAKKKQKKDKEMREKKKDKHRHTQQA